MNALPSPILLILDRSPFIARAGSRLVEGISQPPSARVPSRRNLYRRENIQHKSFPKAVLTAA